MKYITILGSTGSIGQSTVSVVQQFHNQFSIYALVANKNVSIMTKQCLMLSPQYACMVCKDAAKKLKENLIAAGKKNIQVLSGLIGASELASLDTVDIVMSAIVGIAGLQPTFSAIRAGKKILLANKESLVTSGRLFIQESKKYKASILPIDSEHNAIFQNLPIMCQQNLGQIPLAEYGVSCIVLTASGGIFLGKSREQLYTVTPSQACIHPNWLIGRKISVDSATMMNKGLEYIEAQFLFNATADEIEILLHPQSIVHAMVYYNDGSILANLSYPDMKIPIIYAMFYPNRVELKQNNFIKNKFKIDYLKKLYFDRLDSRNYPCLQLAIDASKSGQAAIIILNAVNEIAVDAFLNEMINFMDIPSLISRVLDMMNVNEPNDIEEIISIDQEARKIAMRYI